MACASISEGCTPTRSQSPGTSESSMKRRMTSSGLSVGHQTACPMRARAEAMPFGSTGAFEGGCNVTDDTKSSKYSYVNVDGPGRLTVRGT